MIRAGTYLAQCVDIHPEQFEVSIQLTDTSVLQGVRVKVSADYASPTTGEFMLPPKFAWGMVTFLSDTATSGVWVKTIPDDARNAIPFELLRADPKAVLNERRNNVYTIEFGDGSVETVYRDGTMLRLTTTKDETVGNTTNRARRTARKNSRTAEYGAKVERKPRSNDVKTRPQMDIVLEHSSGTEFRITADGSVLIKTAKGHTLKLHDGTERARDNTGAVTDQGENATRESSGIVLETEKGSRVSLMDDPLGTNLYMKLETPDGRSILLDDKNNKTVISEPVRLEMICNDVRVGSSGALHKVALADKTETRLQALESWAAGHTHIVVTGAFGVVTGVSGVTSPPSSTAADDTASTVLKTKE